MSDVKIVYKNVGDLIPYGKNPRLNDSAVDAVANSIKEFGFKVPIVIDNNNVIIAGHTRLKASVKLGIETVPCIVADDLNDEQIKAFRLADNKTGELADWDFEMLTSELDEIDELNMELFGFDVIDDALDNLTEQDMDDEFDEDECDVEPIVKRGEVWKLGNHRLMCGDSVSDKDIIRLMDGDKADLLITDPPYNVNYGSTRDVVDGLTIINDNLDDSQFRQFIANAFLKANNVMNDGASFYIWHAGTESYNFHGACRDVGWKVRQVLIWVKNSLALGRQDYQWKHEPCIYGWKDGCSHNWYNDRKQTTVLEFDKPLRNGIHPTMKPVELFAYQIGNSSKKNDIVLDLFGGSGTTIVACEKLNRNARVMELDEHYCDVIIARWEQLTGKKAERIE